MTNESKSGTSSDTSGTIDLNGATTEDLQKIKNEIVKKLAERSKSADSSPLSLRNTGHDSVYHSKH